MCCRIFLKTQFPAEFPCDWIIRCDAATFQIYIFSSLSISLPPLPCCTWHWCADGIKRNVNKKQNTRLFINSFAFITVSFGIGQTGRAMRPRTQSYAELFIFPGNKQTSPIPMPKKRRRSNKETHYQKLQISLANEKSKEKHINKFQCLQEVAKRRWGRVWRGTGKSCTHL